MSPSSRIGLAMLVQMVSVVLVAGLYATSDRDERI